MADLWTLLISAQESPTGIPESLLQKKKEELKKRSVRDPYLYFSSIVYKIIINKIRCGEHLT